VDENVQLSVSWCQLPTSIPGEPGRLSTGFLFRSVNATTSFLLIFVSSKTVQYRRRHRLPKFDPENRFRVNSVSLFRPSVFRRGSTSTPCTVSNLFLSHSTHGTTLLLKLFCFVRNHSQFRRCIRFKICAHSLSTGTPAVTIFSS
jgi:hypothetical protein